MLHHIFDWNSFHSINFNFRIVSLIKCIRNRIDIFFVYLKKSRSKIVIFVKIRNRNLGQTLKMLSKLKNFAKNWKFCRKLKILSKIKIFNHQTCMQWMARPGPVNSFLWQIWHLKWRAFWCWISTASSSNSRLQYQHHGRTDFLFLRPIFKF